MSKKTDPQSFIVKISDIDAAAYKNSRLYENRTSEDRLVASILQRVEAGESPLINPVTVGPEGEHKKTGFPLKAGFTRLRACLRAGLTEVQIKIDGRPFLEVNADENLDRADLHIAEQVNIAGRFADAGDDVNTIAKKVKLSASSVRNYLRVYNCKPVWEKWKETVSSQKTHDFAPKIEEIIKLVGEYNEAQKEAVAKERAAERVLKDDAGKPVSPEEATTPEAKKLLAAAIEADVAAATEKVAEKFAAKIENAAEKRKEKAKEKAAVKDATGKPAPREKGKRRPGSNAVLDELQQLKNALAFAESLRQSKETDQAIVGLAAAIEVIKWVTGAITTPVSKKNKACQVVADMVTACKSAADEAEKASKAA